MPRSRRHRDTNLPVTRHAHRATAAVGVPSRLPGPWIVDSRYDHLFLCVAWCIPLILCAIAWTVPYGLLVALVLFVLLDNSHQVATLPLTLFDPVTMRTSAATY